MSPVKPKKIAVLGAGLSGLSVAYRLCQKANVDIEVIERDDRVGGLAKSFEHNGFTVDLGPHRFHTQNEAVMSEFNGLLGKNQAIKERKSRIYMQGKFFSWPLVMSEALKSMPISKTFKIGGDYLWARWRYFLLKPEDKSYEDWVVNRFGREIFNLFFRDYNAKLWGLKPNEISKDWASQRVSLKGLWDAVVQSVFKPKKQARTNVSRFHYPIKGGIGMLSRMFADQITWQGGRIVLNTEVTKMESSGDKLTGISIRNKNTGQSETRNYDYVFSTLPLTKMVEFIAPSAEGKVIEAAQNLKFKSLIFVYCVINRPKITPDHWIYLPQAELATNRISEIRNFSEQNVIPGKTILCGEISCDFGDPVWRMSTAELQKKFLGDLSLLKFISQSDLEETFVFREEFAYPIYDIPYAQNMQKTLAYLKSFKNLTMLGRNGLFRYNNMDHCLEMGFKAADKFLGKDSRYEQVATEDKFFG